MGAKALFEELFDGSELGFWNRADLDRCAELKGLRYNALTNMTVTLLDTEFKPTEQM